MKLLIAVVQCQRDLWRIPAHREMLCHKGADVRFFYGEPRGAVPGFNHRFEGDQIILPIDDAYFALVAKCCAIYQWALDQGYDFIFKIDADTWLDVPKLLQAGFEKHDWVGLMGDKGASGGVGHCTSGGVGIWLSRKAMQTFLDHYPKMPAGKFHLFEDWALSLTLAAAGMKPVNSDLLWNFDLGPADKSQLISWHGWTPDPKHEEQRGGGEAPCK